MSKDWSQDAFFSTLEIINGRDKLSKFLQYLGRFGAWYFSTHHINKDWAARAQGVNKGFATARKLSRVLKWGPILTRAYAFLYKLKGASLKEILTILSQLGYANYFFADNIVWFIQLGLIKRDGTNFQKWSMWGWFLGVVIMLFKDLVDVIGVTNKVLASGLNDESNHKEIKRLALAYTRNISDLCIALNGTQLAKFSEGYLGICGMVAALIGWYELWPTAKKPTN